MQQVSHRAMTAARLATNSGNSERMLFTRLHKHVYVIFFLQLLGKSMPALVLLPVAMTGAAMTARSKSSSMSLGSFD